MEDKLATKFVYDWRLREYTAADGKGLQKMAQKVEVGSKGVRFSAKER